MKTLRLNDVTLEMAAYQEESEPKRKIAFTLNVTSETYHDIAVLLYEKTFTVEVPERNLAFGGEITNYSTSLTNLYEAGSVSEFYIEITETDKNADS
ncbi:YkvR family protein [Bacillus spizizenii]|nr:YkvR family protein [Bacillus spizizenii]MCY9001037.1 YkvR family protein [Bacillus spizizenii]